MVVPDDESLDELVASDSEVTDPFVVSIKTTYGGDVKLKDLIDRAFDGDIDHKGLSTYFKETHFLLKTKRPSENDTWKYSRKIKIKRYARMQQKYYQSKKDLADMIIFTLKLIT